MLIRVGVGKDCSSNTPLLRLKFGSCANSNPEFYELCFHEETNDLLQQASGWDVVCSYFGSLPILTRASTCILKRCKIDEYTSALSERFKTQKND